MISKIAYRKQVLAKRSLFTKEMVKADSEKMLQFIKEFNFSNKTIHIFLPIQNSNEIDTWPIFEHLLINNNKVGTSITKFKPKRLEHTFINKNTTYEMDNYGIPVPNEIETLKETLIDVVLIPLLVCDFQGNRIGYGAGFYDSFLVKCKPDCLKIGLSFFEPIEETINTDAWDIKLDQLITPSNIISF